jgi:hypothetical protein
LSTCKHWLKGPQTPGSSHGGANSKQFEINPFIYNMDNYIPLPANTFARKVLNNKVNIE